LAFAAATFTVAEATKTVTISVNRSGGSSGAVSVHYATANGSATSGANYTGTTGTLTWASGDAAAKTFAIPISNATPFTGAKTFTVALSSPTASATLGATSSATVTIDGSAASTSPGTIALSANAYSVGQNAGSITVNVARSGGSSGAVSVRYATGNGTAAAGTDYTAASGTLNWATGDAAAKTFTVIIANTTLFSGNKTFNVSLSGVAGGATLGTASTAVVTIDGAAASTSTNSAFSTHIVVDQFGYRPNDPKVAVIRVPHVGYDSADAFTPAKTYELHSATDNSLVISAAPTVWNGGATESDSGDSGLWFDFSSVTTSGSYYVFDPTNNVRSAIFPINQTVYKPILKAAVRMYFYQRAGFAKAAPYADKCWQDAAAYVGPNQDTQAHDISDPTNAAKVKDVSGGWFDAGDTDKYLTYAVVPVHQLLTAYQENPSVFTDDFNIPESGNGVPDVLDEVKWETDWVKKMQNADGSVGLKVGDIVVANPSPPSTDTNPRYYIATCTSSTIAAAGMMAHASYVYNNIASLKTEAATLKSMAIAAWNNYQSIPTKQTACDNNKIQSGNADWDLPTQQQEAVVAAVYLFAITGDVTYSNYVSANYKIMRPYNDIGWMRYQPEQGQSLLFYTTLANADATLKASILAGKLADVQSSGSQNVYGFSATADLYRNTLSDYIWGSNQVRANYGNTNTQVSVYNIAVASTTTYQTRALDTLHYFHGVNPFGMVYLSNMYIDGYGATNSVNEIFHAWFSPGTIFVDAKTSSCGPAPGYLPGGPNVYAGSEGVPASEAPPVGQPAQKSFKGWDGYDDSWVVAEPGIYYQSAYVQLLSHFAN
jgi:endoglucanase